jgi:hypothetical protein
MDKAPTSPSPLGTRTYGAPGRNNHCAIKMPSAARIMAHPKTNSPKPSRLPDDVKRFRAARRMASSAFGVQPAFTRSLRTSASFQPARSCSTARFVQSRITSLVIATFGGIIVFRVEAEGEMGMGHVLSKANPMTAVHFRSRLGLFAEPTARPARNRRQRSYVRVFPITSRKVKLPLISFHSAR